MFSLHTSFWNHNHKNYYESHRNAPYCNFVIDPKLHKLIAKYGSDLKDKSKWLCYQVPADVCDACSQECEKHQKMEHCKLCAQAEDVLKNAAKWLDKHTTGAKLELQIHFPQKSKVV